MGSGKANKVGYFLGIIPIFVGDLTPPRIAMVNYPPRWSSRMILVTLKMWVLLFERCTPATFYRHVYVGSIEFLDDSLLRLDQVSSKPEEFLCRLSSASIREDMDRRNASYGFDVLRSLANIDETKELQPEFVSEILRIVEGRV